MNYITKIEKKLIKIVKNSENCEELTYFKLTSILEKMKPFVFNNWLEVLDVFLENQNTFAFWCRAIGELAGDSFCVLDKTSTLKNDNDFKMFGSSREIFFNFAKIFLKVDSLKNVLEKVKLTKSKYESNLDLGIKNGEYEYLLNLENQFLEDNSIFEKRVKSDIEELEKFEAFLIEKQTSLGLFLGEIKEKSKGFRLLGSFLDDDYRKLKLSYSDNILEDQIEYVKKRIKDIKNMECSFNYFMIGYEYLKNIHIKIKYLDDCCKFLEKLILIKTELEKE